MTLSEALAQTTSAALLVGLALGLGAALAGAFESEFDRSGYFATKLLSALALLALLGAIGTGLASIWTQVGA